MSDTKPDFPARFATMREAGVLLPLSADAAEPGVIVDSHGHDVLVVDYLRERSDADVARIAGIVASAVNAWCGLFEPRASVNEGGTAKCE